MNETDLLLSRSHLTAHVLHNQLRSFQSMSFLGNYICKSAQTSYRTMFLVWTSEGGALQYVGLGLFLLQMLPRMFPDLTTIGLLAMVVPSAVIFATVHAWQSGDLEQIQHEFIEWRNRLKNRLSAAFGLELSDWGVSTFLSTLVGALLAMLLLMDTYLLSVLSQMVALGVVSYTHFYGPALNPPGRRRPGPETPAERASRIAKMKEIAQRIQTMPVEPFVPQENIHSQCSISQLKDMLKRRGVSDEELKSYVERQNLEETLSQRRKYSDTCCICFECYEPDEPLRILPRCHHELHLECLDKWAFTFASASKRQHDPTCPLCKEKL